MTVNAASHPLLKPVYFSVWIWLLVALPSATVWASDSTAEIRQWFDKMSRAGQKLSYEGTFLYRRGDQVMTMKIIHVGDEDGERERIISLNGPVREIVRDRRGIAHISTDNKKSISVDKGTSTRSIQSKTPEQIEQTEKYYTFSIGGDARTANRQTRVINIVPKDIYRYGYRVALDYQTGLLLQSELLSEQGAPLEQIIFITFDVLDKGRVMALDIPATNESPHASALAPSAVADMVRVLPGDEGWKISKVPTGFVLAEHKRRMNKDGAMVDHMVFTDGLASVSIFMEKQTPPDKVSFAGVSRMGAVNAFAKRVNDYQVTVVGEVPVAAVQMIGESIYYPPLAGNKK